jgi:predicted O-linked N-acetylglucosamine transferase (SPINDLY family)
LDVAEVLEPGEAALFAPEEAALFEEGQALRAAGDWRAAIAALEAASLINPGRAETLLSLAVLRLQHGEPTAAIGLVQRALGLRPGYAHAWATLGHAQMALADPSAALESFTQASALAPADLGFVMHRMEAAIKCNQTDALRDSAEAELAANPLSPAPLVSLGTLALHERRAEDAIDLLEAALTLDHSAPEPPMLLGSAYSLAMLPARAVPMQRLALDRDPENIDIMNDLAANLGRLYRFEEAVALFTSIIEKSGPSTLVLSNLAAIQSSLGEMEASREAAQEAMLLAPKDVRGNRAWCNQLPYQDGISAAYLLAALEAAAALLPPQAKLPVTVSRDPARKLRIGLLSNTLRRHPVGWLTLAGLEALDREAFSVHCFGRFDSEDVLANRFARFSASWQDTESMNDAALARCIHSSEIDILIDLGGFGDAGRINACAYRPAPLQVKWVGMQYHSTGLPFIDYFLTDNCETPPGYEAFYSEKLLRLPDGYICYAPPAYAPEIGTLPAARNGHITFGCLNNMMKMTPSTLSAWAEILHAVPDSHLLLRAPQFSDPGPRERISKYFADQGISAGRLQLCGRAQHRDFLNTYNEVDIALDPFPYSGGLSTCEAVYMGVPVLARAGEIFAARHSVSHLSNVGLPNWIAYSDAEYVSKAISFAADLQELATLRATLRHRVTASPLCDAPRFGKNLGQALRNIWVEYCRSQDEEIAS